MTCESVAAAHSGVSAADTRRRRVVPVRIFNSACLEKMDEIFETTDLRSPEDFEIGHSSLRISGRLRNFDTPLDFSRLIRRQVIGHGSTPVVDAYELNSGPHTTDLFRTCRPAIFKSTTVILFMSSQTYGEHGPALSRYIPTCIV